MGGATPEAGPKLLTDTASPKLSVPVTVTVVGPAGPSGAGADQLHVPAPSFCVTVPTEVMNSTVLLPCASEKVPEFDAGVPSSVDTLAAPTATVGGWFKITFT